MNGRLTGLVEQLMWAAIGLVITALLVVLAVHLLLSVVVPLLVIFGVVVAGYGLFLGCRLVRRRRAGW